MSDITTGAETGPVGSARSRATEDAVQRAREEERDVFFRKANPWQHRPLLPSPSEVRSPFPESANPHLDPQVLALLRPPPAHRNLLTPQGRTQAFNEITNALDDLSSDSVATQVSQQVLAAARDSIAHAQDLAADAESRRKQLISC